MHSSDFPALHCATSCRQLCTPSTLCARSCQHTLGRSHPSDDTLDDTSRPTILWRQSRSHAEKGSRLENFWKRKPPTTIHRQHDTILQPPDPWSHDTRPGLHNEHGWTLGTQATGDDHVVLCHFQLRPSYLACLRCPGPKRFARIPHLHLSAAGSKERAYPRPNGTAGNTRLSLGWSLL